MSEQCCACENESRGWGNKLLTLLLLLLIVPLVGLALLLWLMRYRSENGAAVAEEESQPEPRRVEIPLTVEPQEVVSVTSPVAPPSRVELPLEEPAIAVAEDAIISSEHDDLRAIEGIGPKVSQLLNDAGIQSFGQLADAEVSRLEQILREAGLPMISPATWPEQARLAAAGRWTALGELQAELKGGRRS